MSRSDRPITRTESRDWRSRVAMLAVDDIGRTGDPEALAEARGMVDRGMLGASLAFAALGMAGAFAGGTAAGELLDPAESRIHAPAMLALVVGVPWCLVLARTLILLALRRRVTPWLGRLVPAGLIRFIGVGHETLSRAVGRRIGEMLAVGSGRSLAAAGTGVLWTTYAAFAILAIWFATARVAFGFGWESSWLPPEVGEAVVRITATPIGFIVDGAELEPVAAPPTAPADDPAALLARRTWITFLTVGITAYLLIPMLAWTILNAAIGHRRATRWRPPETTATTVRRNPVPQAPPPTVESANVERRGCTHLVRVERPADAAPIPAPLAGLDDLGDDDASHHDVVEGDAGRRPARMAILAWAPATPDRGIRRRLAGLATRSSNPPLLVLDGGDRLRDAESQASAAIRLEDWRRLAGELGIELLECDLGKLTTRSSVLLERAIAGASSGSDAEQPRTTSLEIADLDGAFAIIGRNLEGTTPLPADEAVARCMTDIAAELGSGLGDVVHWHERLAGLTTLDSASVPERLEALREIGLGGIPATLRSKAAWIGVGGMLGVAACAAAAVVAPAALLAMPAWAGTGAGIAGLVSLARPDADPVESPKNTDTPDGTDLGTAILALAAAAVLWWSQGGDESRTATLLETLAPDKGPPRLADADDARRWLAAARGRVAARMESTS
ncbi:MAG: hypothetical protein CMJ52_01655 [Planctomycetaceae bacterium]|nr:hypothetical protein [Planctomycetaceae bacterium]